MTSFPRAAQVSAPTTMQDLSRRLAGLLRVQSRYQPSAQSTLGQNSLAAAVDPREFSQATKATRPPHPTPRFLEMLSSTIPPTSMPRAATESVLITTAAVT